MDIGSEMKRKTISKWNGYWSPHHTDTAVDDRSPKCHSEVIVRHECVFGIWKRRYMAIY